MVGIVVVSHSKKIAEGTVELALQMAPNVPIKAAGGLKDGGIGTDVEKISKAIESVISEEGVIVLADLGSSIMCSEIAIEACSKPEIVKLVDAPLVESAVFAASESSSKLSIDTIIEDLHKAKNSC